jgi:hypothetical protein
MITREQHHQMEVMRLFSFIATIAIIRELVAAKDPVPHKALSFAVNVLEAEVINMQYQVQNLERLGIIELIGDKEEIVCYRLKPDMDAFSAGLIKLLFPAQPE